MAERPMNELPMYGGQHDPSVDRNPDFSKDAVKRGWKAYYEGDPDKAMRRFNQAWMFNRDNPEVYWGFGLVMQRRAEKESTKENLKEAIELLALAHEKAPQDGRILGDLAFAHSIFGNHLMREGEDSETHLSKASKYFEKAYELTPDYPPIVAHWAMHLFWVGDIKNAKEKVAKAQDAGYRFKSQFLEDLKQYSNANQSE
jgi:tetratricopeptide (TPR) repeat protein